MTRNELTEMIRQEIRSLAFEELRNKTKKIEAEKSKIFKPKGLSEEEVELSMFHGGVKPDDFGSGNFLAATIKESYDSGLPQIKSSEVSQFEDSFEEMLSDIEGASVVFDKQSNGYSLKMWIGPEGIEAGASGVIEMGHNGRINWSYSLKNGLTISAEDLSVDKGNRNLIEKLYNNYNSWQKDWRERLTIRPGQSQEESPSVEQSTSVEAQPAP